MPTFYATLPANFWFSRPITCLWTWVTLVTEVCFFWTLRYTIAIIAASKIGLINTLGPFGSIFRFSLLVNVGTVGCEMTFLVTPVTSYVRNDILSRSWLVCGLISWWNRDWTLLVLLIGWIWTAVSVVAGLTALETSYWGWVLVWVLIWLSRSIWVWSIAIFELHGVGW